MDWYTGQIYDESGAGLLAFCEFRPPEAGPYSKGMAVDSDGCRVISGFDRYGLPTDLQTTRANNLRSYHYDYVAMEMYCPGGAMDQAGIQGPYGFMGGQRGFNPNTRDYWANYPKNYGHRGLVNRRFDHRGTDPASYARLFNSQGPYRQRDYERFQKNRQEFRELEEMGKKEREGLDRLKFEMRLLRRRDSLDSFGSCDSCDSVDGW